MFDFLKHTKKYFAISGIFILIGIGSLIAFGLDLGIDFTGGSLLEIRYEKKIPSNELIESAFQNAGIDTHLMQVSDNNSILFRFKDIDEKTHQSLVSGLIINQYPGIELRFDSIGPVIGNELKTRSFQVLAMALIAIVLFVAWAFRKASRFVSSWRFGLIALITLFHDVIITIGLFALISNFTLHATIGVPFIAALLTILGYSVNDTIIIFDRIREHLTDAKRHYDMKQLINKSLRETITRSINTSATTILVLLAIFFFGGITTQYFVLTLIIGITIGTYSSLFIASPLIYIWMQRERE